MNFIIDYIDIHAQSTSHAMAIVCFRFQLLSTSSLGAYSLGQASRYSCVIHRAKKLSARRRILSAQNLYVRCAIFS